MSYQAVIRNSNDALVTNTRVGMQVSILQGSTSGTRVYVETHEPTTNANGLASIEIGNGNVVIGNFSSINWANGPYFIKVETDLNGGTNYTIAGISQLLSVPYALHARTAEALTGTMNETDPVFASWDKNFADLTNVPPLFDGNYASLANRPNIRDSVLTLGFSGNYSDLTNTPVLAPVAISGSYSDLTNRPVLFDGQYGSLTGAPVLAPVAKSGSFNDLTNTPVLAPVAISGSYSDLTNRPVLFDGQYGSLTGAPELAAVATSGSFNDLTNTPVLAPVAISGSYSDLTNRPVLFDGQYGSLTGAPVLAPVATSGSFSDLTNTPVLAPVAISGSYSDLTNRPVLFDGNYASLTNRPNIRDSVLTLGFSGNYSDLTNTPVLAPVAVSGSYSDLTNQPNIRDSIQTLGFSGNYSDLTNVPAAFTPAAHQHSAVEITTGTIAIERLPVGTTATTVAAGNHTHSQLVTPVGVVQMFVGSTAPSGYLLCQGQAVSRTTYAALFAVMGTTYGAGDGSTTFNLPDLRQRVPVGRHTAGGTFGTLGNTGGSETHAITVAQLPNYTLPNSLSVNTTGSTHSHFYSNSVTDAHSVAHTNTQWPDGWGATGNNHLNYPASATRSFSGWTSTDGAHTHGISGSITSGGSGQAIPIVQPYLVMNFIIKY